MTLAVNLANLANNVNGSGQLGAANGLSGAVQISNGGTSATTAAQARINLGVPALDGTGATGTWPISINGNAATATNGIPSGTFMLLQQTTAPTGWTKQTANDNKALRVVSGTAGAGGSVPFTTAFSSGLNSGQTTIAYAQMPSHQHTLSPGAVAANFSTVVGSGGTVSYGGGDQIIATTFSGGGGSHSHSLPSFDVAYVDLIIARKD